MRQIINGKLYSTESATLKAARETGSYEGSADDDFVAQSLYRTKDGEYFLWITEMSTNSSVLELMNPNCLMNWLNDHNYSDAELAEILDVELA